MPRISQPIKYKPICNISEHIPQHVPAKAPDLLHSTRRSTSSCPHLARPHDPHTLQNNVDSGTGNTIRNQVPSSSREQPSNRRRDDTKERRPFILLQPSKKRNIKSAWKRARARERKTTTHAGKTTLDRVAARLGPVQQPLHEPRLGAPRRLRFLQKLVLAVLAVTHRRIEPRRRPRHDIICSPAVSLKTQTRAL
jgi:hypothetical protein